MINKAYGIVKVFFTRNIIMKEDIASLRDGMEVKDESSWSEIHITRPGSLLYDFEKTNGVNICKATLTYNALSQPRNDGNDLFYLAVDVNGVKHLIGLGDRHDTLPKTGITDKISDSAGEGCVESVKVSWMTTVGRITVQ